MDYYGSRSVDDSYFQDRLHSPYRSTLALDSFLGRHNFFESLPTGSLVADVACGTGSETAWLATKYQDLKFVGLDKEPNFIAAANSRYTSIGNVEFFECDLYHPEAYTQWKSVQAIWLSQTLSWLPWWTDALDALVTDNVTRIGISTLAWGGEWESEVIHHTRGRENPFSNKVNFNVYSIPKMDSFMLDRKFVYNSVEAFEIDIDLSPPADLALGSYTRLQIDGSRLTFSMWQSLPWHFFHYAREEC